MVKKARLGLYLEDEKMKKQIKIAAAKKGLSTTVYCEEAIRARLKNEGELNDSIDDKKKASIARMNELRQKIGPIGIHAADLVKEGRRR